MFLGTLLTGKHISHVSNFRNSALNLKNPVTRIFLWKKKKILSLVFHKHSSKAASPWSSKLGIGEAEVLAGRSQAGAGTFEVRGRESAGRGAQGQTQALGTLRSMAGRSQEAAGIGHWGRGWEGRGPVNVTTPHSKGPDETQQGR